MPNLKSSLQSKIESELNRVFTPLFLPETDPAKVKENFKFIADAISTAVVDHINGLVIIAPPGGGVCSIT